jgi:hypothetical protein
MGRKRTNRRDTKRPHAQPVVKGKNIKRMLDGIAGAINRINWVTLIIGAIIAFGVAYYYFVRAERRTQHSINYFQTHGKYPEQQKLASIPE